MYAPTAHAFDDLVVVDIDFHHCIDLYPLNLEGFRLRYRAWKPVKHQALLGTDVGSKQDVLVDPNRTTDLAP